MFGHSWKRTLQCCLQIGAFSGFVLMSTVLPAVAEASLRQTLGESSRSGDASELSPFRAEIETFYAAKSYRPIWLDKGSLNTEGQSLLQALAHLQEQGIAFSERMSWPHGATVNLSDTDALAYDQRLTDLLLRYASALRTGNSAPEEAGMTWAIPRPSFQARQFLASIGTVPVTILLNEQAPPQPEYAKLAAALTFYREIRDQGGWPLMPDGPVLGNGDYDPRVPILRRRLAIEGYIAAAQSESSMLFDTGLAEAVKGFQQSHGLARDGKVGRQTLAALNIFPEQRVEQILVNMERWRWMPRDLPSRRIEVNVAAAWLEVVDDKRVVLSMKTIVGSPTHPTPMLQAVIRSVVVNPVWNVPTSITRKEILPRLRRDPGYLRDQNIRILGRPSDPYGLQIDWKRASSASFRLQQQPGPLNALGRLKFDMPNPFDVYLHDTPARALFDRDARALSHGCIRLQAPGRLAAYLLRDPGESFSARIGEGYPTRLDLDNPIPVYLTYWTAFAEDGGQMQFRKDVYGLDARMGARLRPRVEPAVMSSAEPAGCPANGRAAG